MSEALWPLTVDQALMDSHNAGLQTLCYICESLRVEALIHQLTQSPQQLIHKFHCYVMTLIEKHYPVVIRDIPVSASYRSISFVCPACRIAHSPAAKPQMTNTRHTTQLITELSLSGFSL